MESKKKIQVREKSGKFILSQENLEKMGKSQGIQKFPKKLLVNRLLERGTCIKGLFWPPLEPKTENCFSPISSY